MIKFINPIKEEPYLVFKEKYDEAKIAVQPEIQAVSISSFNKDKNQVDARYVNLKFIHEDKFIFFTNYNSPKSIAFESNNQIAALFYWSSTNIQIRMRAKIFKTTNKFNEEYFKNRSLEKNALAISSNQSKSIASYEKVVENYNKIIKSNDLKKCPDYWGGYYFIPNYFEFWTGNDSRINKRNAFKKVDHKWQKFFLEP